MSAQCRWLHKWGKWSAPYEMTLNWRNRQTGEITPSTKAVCQERFCERCNKREWRQAG